MARQTLRTLTLSAIFTTALVFGGGGHLRAASAATYYVATTGNDANPGTQALAFRTIAKGLSILAAGDTLYIRGGTYEEAINSNVHRIPSGTSWSNAPLIASYPGETAILRPTSNSAGAGAVINVVAANLQYVVFDRLTLDAIYTTHGISIGQLINTPVTHHIRFQNGDIKNAAQMNVTGEGAYIEVLRSQIHDAGHGQCNLTSTLGCYGFYWKGNNSLFDGNQVYNNGGYGFHLYHEGLSDVDNNIVRNNAVNNNGFSDYRGSLVQLDGILLSSGGGNIAYNNVVYGNKHSGIRVAYTRGDTNNQVYNNTAYGNGLAGIELSTSAPSTVVRNNILAANQGVSFVDRGASGTVVSNNLCDTSGTGCAIVSNPKLVNPAGQDFHLQADSPAIDVGLALSQVTTDYYGIPRPQGAQYDVGASEYQGSQSPPAPPKNLKITSAP
jgi:parallel beta-helix repeat protein